MPTAQPASEQKKTFGWPRVESSQSTVMHVMAVRKYGESHGVVDNDLTTISCSLCPTAWSQKVSEKTEIRWHGNIFISFGHPPQYSPAIKLEIDNQRR